MDSSEFPFISIVIIGLNEEANLEACMQSILASNYPINKMELIYVDSGSTDDSVAIAKKYTSAVYVESKFPTASRNRNRGLIESSNDIVHFQDGDVKIHPDYLLNAVQTIVAGKAQAVCGKLIEINKSDEEILTTSSK